MTFYYLGLYYDRMKKSDFVKLIGDQKKLALLAGVAAPTISNWPEDLPAPVADRLLGACIRAGVISASAVVYDEIFVDHGYKGLSVS